MTDQERTQLVQALEQTAADMGNFDLTGPGLAPMIRRVATRIRDDGHRLKAQSQMAVTLNDTMEQALVALAANRARQSRRVGGMDHG